MSLPATPQTGGDNVRTEYYGSPAPAAPEPAPPAAQEPANPGANPIPGTGQTPQPGGGQGDPNPAQAADPAAPPGDSGDLAERFALLAKRDRAIQERERALKEREPEFNKFVELTKMAKENPKAVIDFAQQHGVTIDDLAQAALSDDAGEGGTPKTSDGISKLEQEIQALKKERENEKLTAQEIENKRIIDEYKGSLTQTAQGDENFELVNLMGEEGTELAYNIIQAHVEKYGEHLPISQEQALAQAEQYLETQLKGLAKSKKLSKLMQGLQNENQSPPEGEPPQTPFTPPAQTQAPQPAAQGTPSMTLTNDLASQGTNTPDKFDHLDDDQASKDRSAAFLASLIAKGGG